MLRQSLLALASLLLCASVSLAGPLAPLKPYSSDELKAQSAAVKKAEMIAFTASLYEILAAELLWKTKDQKAYDLFLSQKETCLRSVSTNTDAFFERSSELLYVQRDFKKATNPAYMKCRADIIGETRSSGSSDFFQETLRPEIDLTTLVSLQENSEIRALTASLFPDNLLARLHFGTLGAGRSQPTQIPLTAESPSTEFFALDTPGKMALALAAAILALAGLALFIRFLKNRRG